MVDISITPEAAAKRFPGINQQVIKLVRERSPDVRLKLVYEWTKTSAVTWPQFRRLIGFLAYIDEMGTLPPSG